MMTSRKIIASVQEVNSRPRWPPFGSGSTFTPGRRVNCRGTHVANVRYVPITFKPWACAAKPSAPS
jgi:hypothetical protein